MKQSWELQRKELNDCRAEITSLKMPIEEYRPGRSTVASDADSVQSQPLENYKEEIISLQRELERLKEKMTKAPEYLDSNNNEELSLQTEERVVEIDEDKTVSRPYDAVGVLGGEDGQLLINDNNTSKPEEVSSDLLRNQSNKDIYIENNQRNIKQNGEPPRKDGAPHVELDNLNVEAASGKMASSFSFSWKLDYFP